MHKVAVTADIEKAFLMIAITEEDRDTLRFFWYKDVFAEHTDIIQLRFARVVFGVTSSPFLLNATIRHHLNKYKDNQPDLVEKLFKAAYVNDIHVITGANNEAEAHELFVKAKEILNEGGFNLQKFYSNSSMLQGIINGQPQSLENRKGSFDSPTFDNAESTQSRERKVLGVCWDPATDQLVMCLEELSCSSHIAHQANQTRNCQPCRKNL